MLRSIVRAVAITTLALGATLAYAISTGPPLSRTGAPAVGGKPSEQLCTQCHSFNPPNQNNGMVEILDLPDFYMTGQEYPIRVRITSTANESYPDRRWGFQITAVYQANGLGAGTWTIPTEPSADSLYRNTYLSTSMSTFKTRVYISHTRPSTRPAWPAPCEWTFSWVAPPVDSGTVLFFAAGNAANGDLASAGSDDQIYTARDTVLAPSLVIGVPPVLRSRYITELEPPYPNPMTVCGATDFSVGRSGNVDLSIYDSQGRKVRTLLKGWRDAGPEFAFWDGLRDDGSQAPNGVYFVRLRAPGEPSVHSRRLVLAR